MTDGKEVYEDGKMFLRRLQRYLDKQSDSSEGQKSFKRITVAEPQGEFHDNSWHLHILLIFEDNAPFIPNDVITDLWGNGITDTHKVYDADGLALYFKVYLTDIEYEDETVNSDSHDEGNVDTSKSSAGQYNIFFKHELDADLQYASDAVQFRQASKDFLKEIDANPTLKKVLYSYIMCLQKTNVFSKKLLTNMRSDSIIRI